jgi:hypothetical protein
LHDTGLTQKEEGSDDGQEVEVLGSPIADDTTPKDEAHLEHLASPANLIPSTVEEVNVSRMYS